MVSPQGKRYPVLLPYDPNVGKTRHLALCKQCSKEFISVAEIRTYCSRECLKAFKESRRIPDETRRCLVCQTAFTCRVDSYQQYCCQYCAGVANAAKLHGYDWRLRPEPPLSPPVLRKGRKEEKWEKEMHSNFLKDKKLLRRRRVVLAKHYGRDPESGTTKRCAQCNQDKPTNRFRKSKLDEDGRLPWCLDCSRGSISQERTRQRQGIYDKRYRKDKRNKLRRYHKEYYQKNKERIGARNRINPDLRRRRWTKKEDALVLDHNNKPAELAKRLGRTTSSVYIRRARLKAPLSGQTLTRTPS